MPIAGLFLSPTAAAFSAVLAEVDTAASTSALPFSIVRLVLLLGWVYLCLYLVQRVEDTPLVPLKYRSALLVITLFLGPLVFLALILMDTKQSGKQGSPFGNIVQRIRGAILRIWHSSDNETDEDSTLRLFDSTGAELSEIYGRGENRVGDRKFLDLTAQIIDGALLQRASDILIDPKDQLSYSVRLRIDGALRTVRDLPADACKAVINSIKAVANMDISERRRPQDGAFIARKGGTTISFRVASAGALNGEKLSIRALNQNASNFTLADAGFPPRQRAVIASALTKPSGMVLVCGPTGSGKTTTLYSMLNQIDRFTHNVITVEDPIEAPLAEASQIEINTKADITFAKALRSILRQDPDVICVGEIRDEETAEIALRAAQTGHLVVATIHCDSNATALIRLLDLGVSPMLLSAGLSLLVSQRLLRKLCANCKKPAQFSPITTQGFRQNGIETKNMCEPVGCELCGGSGYYGRTAISDVLVITEQLRTEIANNPAIAAKLRTEAEKRGRSTLATEAMRAAVAGITSLEEIKRVVG